MNAVARQVSPADATAIDESRLNELMARVLTDFGAAYLAPLVVIGDRLGLYRALARIGPCSSGELAAQTDTAERYVREWFNAHAASGYVTYDAASGRYAMTPEQAMVFAHEDSPAFIAGGFQAALAAGRIVDRAPVAFRTGEGIGWHEHDHGVSNVSNRSIRPASLPTWVRT